jgi:hypothetical protein
MRRSLRNLHRLCRFLVDAPEIIHQMKCVLELSKIVVRLQTPKPRPFSMGFIHSSCRRERQDSDRSRVDVSVGLPGAPKSKYSGLLDLSQPQQAERPRAENRKQHRIQRAEKGGGVGGLDGAFGIADLAMYHGQRVMSRSVARA